MTATETFRRVTSNYRLDVKIHLTATRQERDEALDSLAEGMPFPRTGLASPEPGLLMLTFRAPTNDEEAVVEAARQTLVLAGLNSAAFTLTVDLGVHKRTLAAA